MEATISDDFKAILNSLEEFSEINEAALISVSDKITALSEKCVKTQLFVHSKDKFDDFVMNIEATDAVDKRLINSWSWLMNRIVYAPTSYHIRGAVVLCVPLVAKYLPNYNGNSAGGETAGSLGKFGKSNAECCR